MEEKKKKCSNEEHKDIDAISYCQDCKIYICNKCSNHHKELFKNHLTNNLDSKQEIFINKCKRVNHYNKLEFFCKNHNQLCCLACICKIMKEGYNQNKDCKVCDMKDIENEKKK